MLQSAGVPVSDPFAGRVTELNSNPVRDGNYVLYWMQRSQRVQFNHALEFAVGKANILDLPVLVVFGLMPDYPDATLRHYRFMVEGVVEVGDALKRRGIGFKLRFSHPVDAALELSGDAAMLVCDRAYLRHLREWRFQVARASACRVVEVESDLIVPVEAASLKQEFAARTIRPRIQRRLGEFLVPLPSQTVSQAHLSTSPDGTGGVDVETILDRLGPPSDPGPVSAFSVGGYGQARLRLTRFCDELLPRYETQRNEPSSDVASGLSPYLHFGQISSLEIALELGAAEFVAGLSAGRGRIKNQPGSVGTRVSDDPRASARDAFLEELIVRRGLAHNYVWYSPDYDRYGGLPDWARRTLSEHAADERPVIYTREQLERCATHDEHWNDAMTEMLVTGAMHTYMRMYWAKKILEWSPSPEEAFETVLELNNRYFLDGRDPNSYANVAWTFGLHDRPWTERPIFGKVRYMNANGLRRKFDMPSYSLKVRRLSRQAGA